MGAHNIHELAVFRLCDGLMKSVEAATATGRVAMDFKFCDQVNDAALDAAADVAEGFARFYPGEFARFSTTRSRHSPKSECERKQAIAEDTSLLRHRVIYCNCAREPTRRREV
jgi:23S rRNA-intervening sequence protein